MSEAATSQAGDLEARPEAARPRRGDHFVQSLERGLAVIRAFDVETPERTLSEVARETTLTRAAARRFLLTLVDLGYVQTDGRLFRLTPRVLELGYAYLSSLELPEVAEPYLQELSDEVAESSSVGVLSGDEVVYVQRIPVARIMAVTISVGTRFPAFATSMGRVLLAGLEPAELKSYLERIELSALTDRTLATKASLRKEIERVANQGYAIVDQELEEGLRSVAVPIHDVDGTVVAAINISAHVSRKTREEVRREFLPALAATASRIETDLRMAAG